VKEILVTKRKIKLSAVAGSILANKMYNTETFLIGGFGNENTQRFCFKQ